MKPPGSRKASLKQLLEDRQKSIHPGAFGNSPSDLIRLERLESGGDLPLVVKPALKGIRLSEWASSSRPLIEELLIKNGALLFRDFKVDSIEEFERLALALSDGLLEYKERSSPRRPVKDRVYTSTDYPEDQRIFLHNENSYQHSWPMKILFFCETPASKGGETPIADCRRILKRINPAIVDLFSQKQWMYVRNFGDGFGLPWETVFQTNDKSLVEEHCRRNGIGVEWTEGNRLRLRSTLPALSRHPGTGEMIWFNHATFFHVSTLDAAMRDGLRAGFNEEDLPANTYYGDGSAIDDSILDELRRAYEDEKVVFPWQRSDVLLLDNMLAAHGRNSYQGPRNILVAMCDPVSR